MPSLFLGLNREENTDFPHKKQIHNSFQLYLSIRLVFQIRFSIGSYVNVNDNVNDNGNDNGNDNVNVIIYKIKKKRVRKEKNKISSTFLGLAKKNAHVTKLTEMLST